MPLATCRYKLGHSIQGLDCQPDSHFLIGKMARRNPYILHPALAIVQCYVCL